MYPKSDSDIHLESEMAQEIPKEVKVLKGKINILTAQTNSGCPILPNNSSY